MPGIPASLRLRGGRLAITENGKLVYGPPCVKKYIPYSGHFVFTIFGVEYSQDGGGDFLVAPTRVDGPRFNDDGPTMSSSGRFLEDGESVTFDNGVRYWRVGDAVYSQDTHESAQPIPYLEGYYVDVVDFDALSPYRYYFHPGAFYHYDDSEYVRGGSVVNLFETTLADGTNELDILWRARFNGGSLRIDLTDPPPEYGEDSPDYDIIRRSADGTGAYSTTGLVSNVSFVST